jgi:hypothetical protein
MAFITKLKPEDIKGIIEAVKSKVEAEVRRKGYTDVIVRDIFPYDDLKVGTTGQTWQFSLVPGENKDVINITLPDDTAIAFYGVRQLEATDIGLIRFRLGVAKVKAEFQIEPSLTEEDKTGYFEEGIIYKPTEVMRVDMAAVTTGTKRLQLLGFLAEPKGKRIIGAVE